MKLVRHMNLWISLSLSIIGLSASANTVTTASTTPTTTVTTASTTPAAPAKTTVTTASTSAAPTPPAATSATAPKKEEPPKASFGFTYEAGYSMQAQAQPDGTRSQSLSHGFTPRMSYGEYRGSINFAYEQDLNDSASNGFGDPAISLSKKSWKLGDYLNLGPSATLIIPTTDNSKNNVTMMYNIGGALSLSLNTKTLGMDALSLSYQLAANKNFTDYDTNAKTGLPNNSHKLRNRLSLGYQITDSFSFFNMFDFNSNYSVNGVVTNSFFSLQSFGYSVNDNVSVSLSHALGGAYLKAGTYENNLKFYDSENSSLSLGVEISL